MFVGGILLGLLRLLSWDDSSNLNQSRRPTDERRLLNDEKLIAEMMTKMRAKRLARAQARADEMFKAEIAKRESSGDESPRQSAQFSNGDDDELPRQPPPLSYDQEIPTKKSRKGSIRGNNNHHHHNKDHKQHQSLVSHKSVMLHQE